MLNTNELLLQAENIGHMFNEVILRNACINQITMMYILEIRMMDDIAWKNYFVIQTSIGNQIALLLRIASSTMYNVMIQYLATALMYPPCCMSTS